MKNWRMWMWMEILMIILTWSETKEWHPLKRSHLGLLAEFAQDSVCSPERIWVYLLLTSFSCDNFQECVAEVFGNLGLPVRQKKQTLELLIIHIAILLLIQKRKGTMRFIQYACTLYLKEIVKTCYNIHGWLDDTLKYTFCHLHWHL